MTKKEMIENGTFVECSTEDHYGSKLVYFSDGKSILLQSDYDIEEVEKSIIEYRGKEYILADYYDIAEDEAEYLD